MVINGERHWVGDEDGEYDAGLDAIWVADANNPLGGSWDFGGDQSPVEVLGNACCFMTMTRNGEFAGVFEYQIPEPAMGGGVKNVARKAGSRLLTRIARWFGFGGKRTIKEIAEELGYHPTNAVKAALKGTVSRENIPVAERELAAKFYERVANEVVSGPKEAAAKALNLERAKFLREGGKPPVDIHPFEP